MNAVEYGHQRHALKEERAKELATIEVEIAALESERAELATLYANVQLELTSLKTDIKTKHAEKATVCEKYLLRMQELEAQFVASKEVKPFR